MSNICADSCFLLGLYDERDQWHQRATDHFVEFFEKPGNKMLVPWPTLYEVIGTRLMRNQRQRQAFERDWRRLASQNQLELIDDTLFRQDALEEVWAQITRTSNVRSLSLVDIVIRRMIDSSNLHINALLSYNFDDFADVCYSKGVELIFK